MAGLPTITGEYKVLKEPDFRVTEKGGAWLKLWCKAVSRVRSQDGTWADGKELLIDVIVSGKYAEHLFDSIAKGDMVVVTGELEPNEWTDKEGNAHKEVRIRADYIGVSVRWAPAKTPSLLEPHTVDEIKETLGAEEVAPF